MKIEQIGGKYDLSEGPHWDEEKNLLYYVDIPQQKIYCWNPETKKITHAYLSKYDLHLYFKIFMILKLTEIFFNFYDFINY